MANHRRDLEKEQFWRLVLEEHSRSGLNARAFCRRESISEPSFYSWRRKIQERDTPAGRSQRANGAALVELMPRAHLDSDLAVRDPSVGIEIETPSGVKIRFDRQPDLEKLSAVLAAIEQYSDQGHASC